MNLLPKIDPEKESKEITSFIKNTFQERSFTRGVLAVSGGVDSVTALILTVKALGSTQVWPLLLPYRNLPEGAVADARRVIEAVGIVPSQVEIVDIAPVVKKITGLLGLDGQNETDRIRIGNIMARCRMIVVFDRAKKHQALVMGTENRSEYLLSYFTRFGDEASDIEPIQHLYKTQVYQLAKYLGVPEVIVAKKPTAGLWSGQTDEGQFGFSYQVADQILFGLYDLKLSIPQLIGKGVDPTDIARVREWVEKNQFKHHLPVTYQPSKR